MKAQASVQKGKKLNVWLESRMKSAIEEFHKGEHGLQHIARAGCAKEHACEESER